MNEKKPTGSSGQMRCSAADGPQLSVNAARSADDLELVYMRLRDERRGVNISLRRLRWWQFISRAYHRGLSNGYLSAMLVVFAQMQAKTNSNINSASHCYASLVDRLRGIYTIPVNDGARPLNGKDTFTRKFDGLPPINEEAAKAIETLIEAGSNLHCLLHQCNGAFVPSNDLACSQIAKALHDTAGMFDA